MLRELEREAEQAAASLGASSFVTFRPSRLTDKAAEVALAEATAGVLAMVQDGDRRGRLADLIAAIEDGAVEGECAQALEELLELGLQTGRLRALYGPAGEPAASRPTAGCPAARSSPRARARCRGRSRRWRVTRWNRSR